MIYNDIHDRPDSLGLLWNLNDNKNVDFVVFNGDIFDYQTGESQLIDHFVKPINPLFSTHTPLVYNRGNHETRGVFSKEFLSYFDMPKGTTYQSFRHGPIYWIFLDTGEDKQDNHPAYADMVDFDRLRKDQQIWLEQVVKTPEFRRAPYRVVVMHIPPMHSGDWYGPTQCKELYLPILNQSKVDLVVSGHTHRHGLYEPTKENYFTLMIGGGPKEGQRTIIDLKADPQKLAVLMKDDAGKDLYRWEKKRS